ncbi:MAG: sodium:solute symporter family protein [Desulfovibrio sp.]|jgi:SSS family solute:Na+ symporter|nr:sodium:solute symporter family protein [Desulfovibrio sp.]
MLSTLTVAVYFALFIFLARKGRGHDSALPGRVGFVVQAFAYVATYISAVALVGFSGLAHAYGLQLLLVAAGNIILGTWVVYRFLAWPTKQRQEELGARSPAMLIGIGHDSVLLGRVLALIFAVFLGVYSSAVIKGAGLLLAQVIDLPPWMLNWLIALAVGACVILGGLRGVLYTEAMQGLIMLVGIAVIVGAVLSRVGGPINGVAALAALPPTDLADNGFTSLSSGGSGLFVLSLVSVTSVAVWAQPQIIQRHFAASSREQLRRTAPLAMLVLTVLLGGMYFAAALSKLILPEVANPDMLMPHLVQMLLPSVGMQLFVLAILSASLSTATALYHIAAMAVSEDLPGRKSTMTTWGLGILLCVLVSGFCAQAEGRLIAVIHTTSWSMVASVALVPYLALVIFGRRDRGAAWCSALSGFLCCLFWYLFLYRPTAIVTPLADGPALIPPFFASIVLSVAGWFVGTFFHNSNSKSKIS